tara:strand:- start:307 stop:930 length:624 start_codon:yes stop_codon:yes gene_type:complete
MENKLNRTNFQGTGWDHFRARDLHKKKVITTINSSKIEKSQLKKENNEIFSWIAETINPLNHLPVVSTVKNLITRSEKTLDIVQSAIGGFLIAGPLGILKGIGGWAANKLTGNFMSLNMEKVSKQKDINPNKQEEKNQKKENNSIKALLYNQEIKRNNDEKALVSSNNFVIYQNKINLSKSKFISKQSHEIYMNNRENYKNKINITA